MEGKRRPRDVKYLDLKQRFGDRYRVAYEESHRGRSKDPRLMIIPCKYGHICPWGGSNLAACTDRPGRIVGRLKRLKFTTVVQDGDDGANIIFDVEYFDVVAEIMGPRKRARKLSEEEKAANVARLKPYRFAAAKPGVRTPGCVRLRWAV